MGKHSIYDFSIGDNVYHLSNVNLKMVVVDIGNDLDFEKITCRWIDANGESHVEKFLPQELGKSNDL